jgi:hypothetical protein
MASYIINAKWYDDRQEILQEESKRLVTAAAKLIVDEIRQTKYDKDNYPLTKDISDLE